VEIDLGSNAVFAKDMVAAVHPLVKAQAFEQMTQVVEPDGGNGNPAQNAPKDLLRGHQHILPIGHINGKLAGG